MGINSGGGGGRVPENHQILGSPNLSYEERLRLIYFNSTNVPPHRMRYNGIYDLPFGRGKAVAKDASGALNAVIGGWQVAFIGDWRSGFWGSVNPGLYWFGDPTLSADERLEMTIFGQRQRLWFRGDFDPRNATNVSGGNLQQLVPVDRAQRVLRPSVGPELQQSGTANACQRDDSEHACCGTLQSQPESFSIWGQARGTSISRSSRTSNSRSVLRRGLLPTSSTSSTTQMMSIQTPRQVSENLGQQINDPRIIQFSLRVEW